MLWLAVLRKDPNKEKNNFTSVTLLNVGYKILVRVLVKVMNLDINRLVGDVKTNRYIHNQLSTYYIIVREVMEPGMGGIFDKFESIEGFQKTKLSILSTISGIRNYILHLEYRQAFTSFGLSNNAIG